MSCNNTNNTCTNCNHNYSSCNNNCAKCGCKDSFLTSPSPCPTPEGCPDSVPCQEVLSSDCIIYNGPNISCNNTVIVTSDSTWAEVLEDLIDYFCITYSNVPLILCSEDTVVTAGSSVNSALQQIVAYFCTEISGLIPVTANNGLNINPASNVRLGGPLMQNTTITNSTFTLDINSTTVAALILSKSSGNSNPTLMINDPSVSTTAQAIQAYSNKFGFTNPVVYFENLSTNIAGSQVLTLNGKNNKINTSTPQLTTPILYITSATTASTTTQVALRVDNVDNVNAGSGIAIEFANSDATIGLGFITNRLISKTVVNTSEFAMTSEFVIQGKPAGIINPIDQLTLKSTGQLQLNKYGIGTFTGVPTYNLSTTALGNVIETTAGLFGTAFRGYISPNSFPSKTFNKANSKIDTGDIVIFNTTNGIIEYQIQDGVNVTSQYNQTTGVWTCPQTGKYDINYNVYLTSQPLPYGWGQVGGTFTIGVTDTTGSAIIYCADTFTAVRDFYYDKLYMTGGIQGKMFTAGTQIVLRIQNLTGVAYTLSPTLGDNIDWAIRRVG